MRMMYPINFTTYIRFVLITIAAVLGLPTAPLASAGAQPRGPSTAKTWEPMASSQLVGDFVRALELFASPVEPGIVPANHPAATILWHKAMKEQNISTAFVNKRLGLAKTRGRWQSLMDRHQTLKLDYGYQPSVDGRGLSNDRTPADRPTSLPYAIALHMTKLQVEEDYDDWLDDNLFVYTVMTYGDLLWGRVSSVYKNLDEGTETLFLPEDRGLFDPKGRFHELAGPLFVDYGIIESDGEDISELARLTKVIIDLAESALRLSSPNYASTALRTRTETQNLISLLIAMDGDDRLVTDSFLLEHQSVASLLGDGAFAEWRKSYSGRRGLSDFRYHLWFRLIRSGL